MLTAFYTRQFERDLKRMLRRGKDAEKFKTVARCLLAAEELPTTYRDHKLGGQFIGHRDCHLEPDWVLIYKRELAAIVFVRTGTHADLFE